ncbi:MAG TPA: DUF503 domain-containing protein [Ktedonobacterales bacterium]
MYTAMARVTLRIPASASLKDKRQVVRSVLAKVRNQLEVAAAEVADQDVRNLAVLGLAYVSSEAGHAAEQLDRAIRYIEQSRPDVEITDVQQDVTSLGG